MSPPTKVDWGDGDWRSAQFVKRVDAGPVGFSLVHDCRNDDGGKLPSPKSFALVKLPGFGGMIRHSSHYWIVPVDSSGEMNEGDTIFIHPKDCQTALMPDPQNRAIPTRLPLQ